MKAWPVIGPVIGNPVFRNSDYRRLWAGSACNQMGMSGEQVILGLLVFQITQSSAWVGVALALYSLPMLIFGALSGAVADWLDRRTLLKCIEVAIAINLVLFSALIASGMTGLPLIMVFTLIAGSLSAIYQPIRGSYAYDLVGGQHIVAGLGMLNLGTRLGQLVGALAAGVVMQRLGTTAALLVLAIAHVMAFAWVSRLRTAGIAAVTERAPIRQNLREYFYEMRSNRVLLMLVVITASVEIFGFSFSTALPELATTRFHLGAEGLGMMHAARAVGGILAGLTLAGMGGLQRRGMVYLAVIYAFGGSLLLLAAAPQFALALAALVVVAVLATASDVLTQSMVQLSVPNRLRGRAMGAWVLAIGSSPLGHLEMGALVVSLGVGGAMLINGAALIGVGILATLAAPRLRKL
jgi:predicted MFS family arabinose efflux permease